MDIIESEKYNEQGNEAFKARKYAEALEHYTKAIHSVKGEPKELAVYYKNRAPVYSRLEQFQRAVEDCNRSLEICPNDPEALLTRSSALSVLARLEEAYEDAKQILKYDPTNKFVELNLHRMQRTAEGKARLEAETRTELESMLKIVLDPSNDTEKRETAMNNLLELVKDHPHSHMMLKQSPVVQKIRNFLEMEKNPKLNAKGIQIIGELCNHSQEKTRVVIKNVDIPWFLEILDSKNEDVVNAVQDCLQSILNTLSGMENKLDSKPMKELVEYNQSTIDTLLTCLTMSINNQAISGLARDAIIELLIRNIHYKTLDWAQQLVDKGGVRRLLDCTSELQEYNYESAMNITPSTRTIAAVCLARVSENMYCNQTRNNFISKVEEYMKEKLLSPDIESKVRVTVAITELLRGPLDLGNVIIGKEGILEMIFAMANNEDDELQQKVACECIIAAADKAKSIISQGTDILKKLCKSKNDHIKIRALVGLCKLGSYGRNDATMKPFAEGSTLKLAEACRRFLLHPGKDNDIRKWAAEGLSYLTLDAEVKKKLIEDKAALKALVELAKSGDQSVIFGVVTALVNLCNAYEKQEVTPEEHEQDNPDFVTKRILALGHETVTTALVALAKTECPNSRELISRVFNALASEQELRDVIVQEGGVKVLIKLALNGTEKGKRHAAQALARIGITMNPEIAFPGQLVSKCIRPLLLLLHQDRSGLEIFEALGALSNIADRSGIARQRILEQGGFPKIEHYMYDDRKYICRAAFQCMCNLVQSSDVIVIFFASENDRINFVVNTCLDKDQDTALAASEMLAIITSYSGRCCNKVFESENWLDAIQCLLTSNVVRLQYMGVCIVCNLIGCSKDLAYKLMECNVLEMLIRILPAEDYKRKNMYINRALKKCEEYGIIKKPDDEQ